MSKIKFPFDKKIFENKKFTKEFFTETLKDIIKFKDKFYGFIQIDKTRDIQYFLFFFKSRLYAAGLISKSRPLSISINDFFNQVSSNSENMLSISLYETDPILLKGILVFIQKEPTIKAETTLIDMEKILDKIMKDGKNTFVVLKEKDMMNFFFFKQGKAVIAHFADVDFEVDKIASIDEILLSYAYPTEQKTVEVLIYLEIKTSPTVDSERLALEDIIKILYGHEKEKMLNKTDEEQQKLYMECVVVEGPQSGEDFNVTPPCVIGRKGSNITIKDPKVSRRHARIKELGRKIIIEDLDSTNGTFVNNERIIVRELHSGDLIAVGDTKIRISF